MEPKYLAEEVIIPHQSSSDKVIGSLGPLPANAIFEVLQHPSGTYVPGWHCHCYQFALWLRVPLRWLPPCETVRTGYPGFFRERGLKYSLNWQFIFVSQHIFKHVQTINIYIYSVRFFDSREWMIIDDLL